MQKWRYLFSFLGSCSFQPTDKTSKHWGRSRRKGGSGGHPLGSRAQG